MEDKGFGPFSFRIIEKGCAAMENNTEKIIERIVTVEQQLTDLKKRWPAHSVKPQMILEMEQLEEEINFLREKYRQQITDNQITDKQGE